MASNGEGKRSASAAELDGDTPTSAIEPSGQGNKRLCYPDPTLYQEFPHPHAVPGYDFNQPSYFDNPSSVNPYGTNPVFNNNLEQQFGYGPLNFQPASSPFAYTTTPIASPYSAGSPFGPPLASNISQQQNSGQPSNKPSHALAFPKPKDASPSASGPTVPPESSPLQATRSITRSRGRTGNSKLPGALRIGGALIEDAGLKIPQVSEAESLRRKGELEAELEYQREHPPHLPRSRIVDLEEKPRHAPWHEIPDNCSDEERKRLTKLNNAIATENQKIERDRNNQAAKKSRQKRLEALNDTRKILNEKAAECDWWRMRAMTLGASAKEWEQVPRQVKVAMVKEISNRVDVIHQFHEEEKKREDAVKRTERIKARSAQRGARNHTPASSS
ncbi:Fc.00g086950.m01.CDS01 [Cosmosporella sp. VM-42]